MAEEAKKVRSAVKCRFTRKLRDFHKYVKGNGERRITMWKFEELRDTWVILQEKHHLYLLHLDEAEMVENDKWMYDVEEEFNSALSEYDKVQIPAQKVAPVTENRVELEAMKPPQFDIVNYPRFKYDFKHYIEPNVASEILTYTLRTCLAKEPAHIVRNVDEIDEMWKLLDNKYADPSTVVDVIMDRIVKTASLSNGENSKFIKFVDMLEDSYRDLRELGLEKEITTTNSVSVIEKILPPEVRDRWARMVTADDSHVNKRDKFPSLLKFLLSEKRAVEYNSSPLRSIDRLETDRVNHVHVWAPKDISTIHGDKSDATWNVTTKRHCLIHGDGNHTTEDCVVFLMKSVDERYDVLRQKGACWSCLQPGHKLRDCVDDRRCGENGCQRRHHASLHAGYAGNKTVGSVHHVVDSESISRDHGATQFHVRDTDIRQNWNNTGRDRNVDALKQRIVSLEKTLKEERAAKAKMVQSTQTEISELKVDKIKLQGQLKEQQSRISDTNLTFEEGFCQRGRNVNGVTPSDHTSIENDMPMYASHRYGGNGHRLSWPFVYQMCLCTVVILALCSGAHAGTHHAEGDKSQAITYLRYFDSLILCDSIELVPTRLANISTRSNFEQHLHAYDTHTFETLNTETNKYSYTFLCCEASVSLQITESMIHDIIRCDPLIG